MAIAAIPSNVTIQQANGNILVEWNFIAGATSYSVQRSTDQITYATVASPAAIQYLDTTPVIGTTYYYKVASVNTSGTSSYSSPVSIAPTLPGQLTLGQIRQAARERSDMVNSQFVTDVEFNSYINQSYFELYDILVQKFGNEYFVATPYQVATSNTPFYTMPDGSATYKNASGVQAQAFYKLLGVDLSLNAGNNAWLTLKKFEFIRRNDYLYPQLTSNLPVFNVPRYRIMGNQVEFIPNLAGNQILQFWYIPRMTALLQDNDSVDGVSGWTEYIIVDAAIKAMQKEESDVTVLMMQKQALLQRIEDAAENRDAGEPETISATRNISNFGNGNDGPIGGY